MIILVSVSCNSSDVAKDEVVWLSGGGEKFIPF